MEPSGELCDFLRDWGIDPQSRAAARMAAFAALLRKWNPKVNLTASTEWSHLGQLFAEGIWASGFYPPGAVRHLDIGSGAGFPALILAILLPRIRLELVESRGRKTAFLETAASELDLVETRVHRKRLCEHLRNNPTVWDCISWKGLRLSSEDLAGLREHAHPGTELWMFHGREPAVERPEDLLRGFGRVRTEKFPGRRDWRLSVFHVKQPGRVRFT